MAGVSLLRALRSLRIVYVIRKLAAFRDLYLMMQGMVGVAMATIFVFSLIFLQMTILFVIAVEINIEQGHVRRRALFVQLRGRLRGCRL